jgi:gluconokinase
MSGHVIVLMGVTSVGKTTVGRILAERLSARFAEGDGYHPPENVAKMQSGTPLDDRDRWPWLEQIALDMKGWLKAGDTAIVTCSALKRSYRDVLRRAGSGVRFVHLKGDPDLLRRRMEARKGHYMPPSLLPSQLAILESPDGEQDIVEIDVTGPPEMVATQVQLALGLKDDGA